MPQRPSWLRDRWVGGTGLCITDSFPRGTGDPNFSWEKILIGQQVSLRKKCGTWVNWVVTEWISAWVCIWKIDKRRGWSSKRCLFYNTIQCSKVQHNYNRLHCQVRQKLLKDCSRVMFVHFHAHSRFNQTAFFSDFFFLLYCPNRFSPIGISGCLPWGKPAATESRYPTYGACWMFLVFP